MPSDLHRPAIRAARSTLLACSVLVFGCDGGGTSDAGGGTSETGATSSPTSTTAMQTEDGDDGDTTDAPTTGDPDGPADTGSTAAATTTTESSSDGSSSGSDGSGTGGESVCSAYDGGNCMFEDLQCWQFQEADAKAAEPFCTNGTYTLGEACTPTNRMGCCQNDVVNRVVCYYEGYPVNAANLEMMCTAANGTWCPEG